MEVSEALDDTVGTAKMRSTIWEWSQSLRSSKNKEKIGNTSKKLEKKLTFFFQKKNQRWKIDVKWAGSGRGRLRPVQNDRTGFPEVLEWVLTKNSLKKIMKNMIFGFFFPAAAAAAAAEAAAATAFNPCLGSRAGVIDGSYKLSALFGSLVPDGCQ